MFIFIGYRNGTTDCHQLYLVMYISFKKEMGFTNTVEWPLAKVSC